MENIFIDGAIATGDSFIGRKEELKRLKSAIFDGKCSVSLVGSTRIGKSSLVREACRLYFDSSKHLLVEIVMAELESASDFWFSLVYSVQEALENAGQFNDEFEGIYAKIDDLDSSHNTWYIRFRSVFKKILRQIAKIGYKLILIIDEFDSVLRIFEQEAPYYQFQRSIYSDPQYNTSGVLISRRRLTLLASKCPHISPYPNVFFEMPLRAFSDADMKEFYDNLEISGVTVSPEGRERLEYYTGRMPHLCSRFARLMVDKKLERPFGGDDVKEIFRDCIPQIETHYDDLIRRLKEDEYLDFIFYLSIGAKVPGERNIENMRQMGVLTFDEKSSRYYAFSKDFMAYLREKPLELPAWDMITGCEKKLKAFFKREYPELEKVTYKDLKSYDAAKIQGKIDRAYSLNLNWGQVFSYSSNFSTRKENPTVVDVLTLSKIIDVIIENWTRFLKYFNGDSEWKNKLNVIKGVRNPAAHGHLEYVSEEELAVCLRYCEEVIRL